MTTDVKFDPALRPPDAARQVRTGGEVAARRAEPVPRDPRAVAVDPRGTDAKTVRSLPELAERAVNELFAGREVDVRSFRDEVTGRMVYRVTDRRSGEVLVQSPPEELLRFYAAARRPPGAPLVTFEA